MRKENRQKPHAAEEPDEDLRKAYKEQAEALQENRQQWRPTWKALGLDFARRDFASVHYKGPGSESTRRE